MSGLPPVVGEIARRVAAGGGRAWVVGGWVRDRLLGRASKDVDLELHGVAAGALPGLLGGLGRAEAVGRSFGVVKLRAEGEELDLAVVEGPLGDPRASFAAAARRRDLTINAMGWDPLAEALIDPLGGAADLRAGRLVAADGATFGEDPLRVARVARFAAQLGFAPDAALVARCRGLSLDGVATERLVGEVEKLVVAPFAGRGFAVGCAIDLWRRAFPELGLGPEVEAALERRVRPAPVLGWAALLTQTAAPSALLERLRVGRRAGVPLSRQVLALGRWGPRLRAGLDDAGLRAAADEVELPLLRDHGLAMGLSAEEGAAVEARARALGLWAGALPALLRGGDLLAMGIPGGPALGRLLEAVRVAQRAGTVTTGEEARALVLRLYALAGPLVPAEPP